jgi:hypothetical protein
LDLAEIRANLKKDYDWDLPLFTFLEDVIDRLPPEYKTKRDKWLEDGKSGAMKRLDLMLALEKEHKAQFPECQKKGHVMASVMGGQPKVKCFSCGQWATRVIIVH